MTRSLFVSASVLVMFVSASTADHFYSIDTSTDELVTIDSETGAITVEGSLGLDFVNVDLARRGNALYALNSTYQGNDGTVTLVEIDPAVPTVVSSVPVTIGGQAVIHGEGLGALSNGQLIAVVSWNATSLSSSNTMGELGLDGVLTNIVDYDSLDPENDADADGMCETPDDRLLWTNSEPGFRRLVEVTLTPTYVVLPDHPLDNTNDMSFGCDDLWAIDRLPKEIRKLDPMDGSIIESIPYDSSRELFGLALKFPNCPVPVDRSTWGSLKSRYR